jgi:putative SOS response-associated peptidase YedK
VNYTDIAYRRLGVAVDGHPLMQRFHKPSDEKRMLVILRPDQYDEWLHCPAEEAPSFFVRYPAERLVAHAAPKMSINAGQETLPEIF